jgi:hypothetical protein
MASAMSDLTKKLARVIVPLKKKEEQAAINAARAYLASQLSDHHRILGADLRINKPSDPGKTPQRMLGVLVLDYGHKRNLEVMVDSKGKVVEVIELHGAQPAFTNDEIKEARKIAEQDRSVNRLAKMKNSFVSEFGPERTPDHARRIGLRYAIAQKGRPSRVIGHAIVDLSARRLVEFKETLSQAD